MNNAAVISIVLVILRHAISAAGYAVWATKHDSELVNLAGALVGVGSILFGMWKAESDRRKKNALAKEVETVKAETETIIKSQKPL